MDTMKSDAKTVATYINDLPPDRQQALAAVRNIILKNLPKGFEENINWGMIAYEVPLAIQPNTYNGQPLMYAALASQKNYMAVYLCGLSCIPDAEEKFSAAWEKTGLKLDMGKSCIRFKKLEDVDLKLIGAQIAATPVASFIAACEAKASSDKHKRQSSKSHR
jgi:ribosomal protein L12E/L44/L45/RPP1/RPP2